MGVFAKLRSSFNVSETNASSKSNQISGNDASTKSHGGYCATTQQPSMEKTTQLATYLVPGSAAVQVSGASTATTVASLSPGDKILGIDPGRENAMIWATLQRIETVQENSMLQNTVEVGLGSTGSASLKAEQVILAKDRHKKVVMQPVRRLEVGVDSVVVFNTDGLQWRGKKAQEVKKITRLRLVRDKNPTEGLYKLTIGSTDHSLLMSSAQDSSHFLVINSTNSTVDLKARADGATVSATCEIPKMEIKNTFITYEESKNEKLAGIPRSYSDTDMRKLAMAIEMEADYPFPTGKPILGTDDVLDLSSNHSSTVGSTLTSKSRASYVSSMSGGSITGIRVGTTIGMDNQGQLTSKGSDQIVLSDYAKLPVNAQGIRISAASANHQPGRRSKCHKCAFYNTFSFKKGKVCKNGALCDFCHETHDRFIHRR